MGDIDTAAVDSLKTLDPKRPIREATEQQTQFYVGFVPKGDIAALPIGPPQRDAQDTPGLTGESFRASE